MKSTDQLINSLHDDLKPSKRLLPVGLQLVIWTSFCFGITWIIFRIFGAAIHKEIVTENPAIFFELIALTGLIILSGYSALSLSRPGQHKTVRWLPGITIVLWLAGFAWAIVSGPEFYTFGSLKDHVFTSCFRNVILLSLVPGSMLFFLVKKGASTNIALASTWIGVGGASIGYLAVRMECPYLEPFHIIFAHLLPMLLLASVVFFIGRKLLRW